MSVELFDKGYYNSIQTSKNYIDMRQTVKIAVYDYICNVFFGKDESRIVYSDPKYAFRARLESLAQGIEDSDNIFINNLQLPFGSFYLTSQPKIIKSVSASEWSGYYDRDLEYYLHFYNFTQNCKVQLWYNQSDDMEIARSIANLESHSSTPARYIENIYWRNKTLAIPVFITVKKITCGQEAFTRSEWLSKSQLWPVVLDLEIESTELHINKGLNAVQLPFKWHNTGNVDTWRDDSQEYYTQKSVLSFATSNWNVELKEPEKIGENIKQNVSALTNLNLEDIDDETAKAISKVLPNRNICEMVKGVFVDKTLVKFKKLKYNEEKTTIDNKTGEVTVYIDTLIHPSSYQYWKSCKIVVPGRSEKDTLYLKTCKTQFIQIDKLHPNSKYTIYFITEDLGGNFNTVPLEFTTPKWSKEILAEMQGTKETINDRQNEDLKEVPLNGLIDLDDEWSGLEM